MMPQGSLVGLLQVDTIGSYGWFFHWIFESKSLVPYVDWVISLIEGDLNFSIGVYEVWGCMAISYPLPDFLTNLFESINLCDIVHVKIHPTWSNNRIFSTLASKWLDFFLILEIILYQNLNFK